MIARRIGYRSRSIVALKCSNYQADGKFAMCFRMKHRKNDEENHWLQASPDLQDFLADLTHRTSPCATTAWPRKAPSSYRSSPATYRFGKREGSENSLPTL
jgi:hypothetical protein